MPTGSRSMDGFLRRAEGRGEEKSARSAQAGGMDVMPKIDQEYPLMNVSTRLLLRFLPAFAFASAVPAIAADAPSVELKGQRFSIEFAEDDAARNRGLMNRTEMAADHGMLFVFQDDAPRAFWMKNTKIPLDMLFFDAERKLVSVQHDVPPCLADPCRGYSSGAPARYVLELNGGQARKLGVQSGDELSIHR